MMPLPPTPTSRLQSPSPPPQRSGSSHQHYQRQEQPQQQLPSSPSVNPFGPSSTLATKSNKKNNNYNNKIHDNYHQHQQAYYNRGGASSSNGFNGDGKGEGYGNGNEIISDGGDGKLITARGTTTGTRTTRSGSSASQIGNGTSSPSGIVRLTGFGPKIEGTGKTATTSTTTTTTATTTTALTQTAASQSQSRPHLHPNIHLAGEETHQKPRPLIYQSTIISNSSSSNPNSNPNPPNPPPPRTSSLLPPPRNTNAKIVSPVGVFDPSIASPRLHSRHHSRSSSIGGASDGFRNLNRWSNSTASSRASNPHRDRDYQSQQQQQQSAPPLQQQQQQQQGLQSPPRKLIKRRPSTDTSASPRTRRPSPPPPPPSSSTPPNLPPIISLPPLDANPESVARTSSPRLVSRVSPAEPQDHFWDDLARLNTAARENSGLLPAAPVIRDAMTDRKNHARGRSSATRGSTDSTKARDRANKPSQKAMLSKALGKANAAVRLDNAQTYGAARDAYIEACDLLQQVLARTNGDDDRKKLEAIRLTYTSRIDELEALVPTYTQNDKALPARPESDDYHGAQVELVGAESPVEENRGESPTADTPQLRASPNLGLDQRLPQSSFSRSQMRRNFEGTSLSLPQSQDSGYMPAPLSPRRAVSPAKPPTPEPIVRQDFSLPSERLVAENGTRSHRRTISHESASWLDPIDESGGSTTSSVHSRTSSLGLRRKHMRHTSGNTEAEFDAALDAAVEAAYDDGYEPMDSYETAYDDDNNPDGDVVLNAMRKVELAKERVRQTEREAAIELARERERQRQMSIDQKPQTFSGDFFDANDSDEDEHVLEEIARRSVMEDFSFNRRSQQSQSKVPRESDSSGMTSRTWHSSVGSNPPTATTVLSTVTEMPPPAALPKTAPPSIPSPPQPLPQVSPQVSPTSGVRNRRFSGQNLKQLKIETSKLGQPPSISTSGLQTKPSNSYAAQQQRQAMSATSTRPGPFSMRAPSSPARGISPAEGFVPPSPPTNQATGGQESDELRTDSPASIRPGIRKNFSSSSLKSLRTRQFSISHIDDSDLSPNTPLTHQISNTSVARQPMIPTLPTPLAAAFHERMTGGIGGLHLFDSDFHSPTTHSPNQLYHHHHLHNNPDVPVPLEPCPSDPMLRPFWLMRALYQTLAHPRGGYISNRLFIPRDAWKVKGVKLRALEDKIGQCDLLTAALLKLARVDSNDADAVLEEMQSFENILEMVQMTLTRKLGNEVGTQGMSAFRDEKDTEAAPPVPRSASVSGKGGAFSWRRLRNKGSAANMTNAYGGKSNSGGSNGPSANERDITSSIGSIPSLPMTAHPSSKPAKRDVASAGFDGPYANYMASLARLFDAAQTVDQIARQVEDPGLRHADKTQVGLELCTRHAAEFFGFYICRFVLADLALLLDKFVKRGSEWVLA
ncbi:uncharacterized protein F4822DRAFT_198290 [Hypoxylon trugodes]|uniref:uncharacterized protein n=1 Tax=Hypoxylon trugodes TaxID=326681 RepID=UPI00219E29DC|nr:uncharacterized protein F4822DRAFT_198290 [Hypoxylon trugodes]KAI1389360.1 hypothetical protein F4822DRAFT_198290 [Hypoxylon trugodes]